MNDVAQSSKRGPDALAALLVRESVLPAGKVEEATERMVLSGGTLDTALLELGFLDEPMLLELMGRAYNAKAVGKRELDGVDRAVTGIFPKRLAEKHSVVPIDVSGRRLTVAVAGPPDLALLDEIGFMLSVYVKPAVTLQTRVAFALARLYGVPVPPRLEALLARVGERPDDARAAVEAWQAKTTHAKPAKPPTQPPVPAAAAPQPTAPPATLPPAVVAAPGAPTTPPLFSGGKPAMSAAAREAALVAAAAETAPPAAAAATAPPAPEPDFAVDVDVAPPAAPAAPVSAAADALPVDGSGWSVGANAGLSVDAAPSAPKLEAVGGGSVEAQAVAAATHAAAQLERADDEHEQRRRKERVLWTVDDAIAELALAEDRDGMVDVVLRFAYRRLTTAAAFVLMRNASGPSFVGWDVIDPTLWKSDIARFSLPAETKEGVPNALAQLLSIQSPFLGPLQREDPLVRLFGRRSRAVILLPILVGDRFVGAVYGDCGSKPIPPSSLAELHMVVPRLGKGLGNLILRKKKALRIAAAQPAPPVTSPLAPPAEETTTPSWTSRSQREQRTEEAGAPVVAGTLVEEGPVTLASTEFVAVGFDEQEEDIGVAEVAPPRALPTIDIEVDVDMADEPAAPPPAAGAAAAPDAPPAAAAAPSGDDGMDIDMGAAEPEAPKAAPAEPAATAPAPAAPAEPRAQPEKGDGAVEEKPAAPVPSSASARVDAEKPAVPLEKAAAPPEPAADLTAPTLLSSDPEPVNVARVVAGAVAAKAVDAVTGAIDVGLDAAPPVSVADAERALAFGPEDAPLRRDEEPTAPAAAPAAAATPAPDEEQPIELTQKKAPKKPEAAGAAEAKPVRTSPPPLPKKPMPWADGKDDDEDVKLDDLALADLDGGPQASPQTAKIELGLDASVAAGATAGDANGGGLGEVGAVVPSPGAGAREALLVATHAAWLAHEDAQLDELVGQLHRPGEAQKRAALAAVVAHKERAMPSLARYFPGVLTVHPFGAMESRPEVGELSDCIACLVRLGPDLAAPLLCAELAHDDRLHRWAAVWALSELKIPGALPRLAQRVFDPEPAIAALALEVIDGYRTQAAFDKVLAQVRDLVLRGDTFQRQRAIMAVGELRDREALAALVDLLGTRPKEVSEAARQALVEISKQDFGTAERRWRAWIADNQSTPRTRWLIEGLASKDDDIRRSAQQELNRLTGQFFGYRWDAPRSDREQSVQAWHEWWSAQQRDAPGRWP